MREITDAGLKCVGSRMIKFALGLEEISGNQGIKTQLSFLKCKVPGDVKVEDLALERAVNPQREYLHEGGADQALTWSFSMAVL